MSVSVSIAGLSAGTYNGTITIADPASQGSPKQVAVKLTLATPDTTAPQVSITAPTDGASVSGTTSVVASAFDNMGVAGVQFKLDGANLGTEVTTSPYAVSWSHEHDVERQSYADRRCTRRRRQHWHLDAGWRHRWEHSTRHHNTARQPERPLGRGFQPGRRRGGVPNHRHGLGNGGAAQPLRR